MSFPQVCVPHLSLCHLFLHTKLIVSRGEQHAAKLSLKERAACSRQLGHGRKRRQRTYLGWCRSERESR